MSSLKKIKYEDYLNDLYRIYMSSATIYETFDKFVEYATKTDRYDKQLGYSYKDVEKENDKA